jgi:hypothetical protein
LVSVPVPVNVPLKWIASGIVGLLPRGKLHPLLTVFLPVLLNATKLKLTLLHVKVARPPSKVIVPPFALKVGVPEIVRFPATVIVPEGALNVPPDIVKDPFRSAPLASVSAPELKVTVPLALNVPDE